MDYKLQHLSKSMSTTEAQQLLNFLREHRGNEANFQQINEAVTASIGNSIPGLQEVQDKYADAYTTAREQGGSAWPEFERYVSELEKCLVAVDKTE